MSVQIEKKGKKKPPPPICWFRVVNVVHGDRTRVGFSQELNKAFGSYAEKIEEKWTWIKHVQSNPGARHEANVTSEDLRQAEAELDEKVRKATGFSRTELDNARRKIQASLDAKPDPLAAAREMGLSIMERQQTVPQKLVLDQKKSARALIDFVSQSGSRKK